MQNRRKIATLAAALLGAVAVATTVTAVTAAPAEPRVRRFVGAVKPETEGFEEWTGGGCSIYCALGDAVSVRSSSQLKGEGKTKYGATQAHDFDLSTAWVEGAAGDGQGEWLEYTVDLRAKEFAASHLALTELRVFNGYRKSKDLWAKNGRFKDFDLTVNGKPYGQVTLKDAYAWQFVEIGSIPLAPGKKTVLRFTARSVYPGATYHDTALTDLGFEGTGHH